MNDLRRVSHVVPITLDTEALQHGQSASLVGSIPQGTTLAGISFHLVNSGWNFRPGYRIPVDLIDFANLVEEVYGQNLGTIDWKGQDLVVDSVLASQLLSLAKSAGPNYATPPAVAANLNPLAAMSGLTVAEVWHAVASNIGITIGDYNSRFRPDIHAQYQALYDPNFRDACDRCWHVGTTPTQNTGATDIENANPAITARLSGGPGRDLIPPLFWYFGPSSDLIGAAPQVLPPKICERGTIAIDVQWGTGYLKNLTRISQALGTNLATEDITCTYGEEDQASFRDITTCSVDQTDTQLVVKLWLVPSADWTSDASEFLVFGASQFNRSVAHGDRIAVTFDGIRPTSFCGNVLFSGTYLELFGDAYGLPQNAWSYTWEQKYSLNQFGPRAPWGGSRLIRPSSGFSGAEVNGMAVDPYAYLDWTDNPLPTPINIDFDKVMYAGTGVLGLNEKQNPVIQIGFDNLNQLDSAVTAGTISQFSNVGMTLYANEYGYKLVKV